MNVVLKIVIALVVCVLGMLTLIPEIQRHREAKAEIERLKRELSNYEAQLAEKKRELRLLQSDPGWA
jgi:AmiR/NasT family two-component response regulator